MEDTLLELIENSELTEFQLDYILRWLSGNGYINLNHNRLNLEQLAKDLFGEFGFSTLTEEQQKYIMTKYVLRD